MRVQLDARTHNAIVVAEPGDRVALIDALPRRVGGDALGELRVVGDVQIVGPDRVLRWTDISHCERFMWAILDEADHPVYAEEGSQWSPGIEYTLELPDRKPGPNVMSFRP